MFGMRKSEMDQLLRLKESGLPQPLLDALAGGSLAELERTRRALDQYETERARFDLINKARIEVKVIPPKVNFIGIGEQLERLERLVERVENLHRKISGENYVENKNEYEN